MKLKELLIEIFEENKEEVVKNFGWLNYDVLKQNEQRLRNCDEFKNVKDFRIIQFPDIENEKGKIIPRQKWKLSDKLSFGNKLYIQTISITPETFNPETIYNPVKDGACITPAIYNKETFKPMKKICIEFSPEELQDGEIIGDEKKKKELITLFKKVLDSPEEYSCKGESEFIIGAIYDEITTDKNTYRQDI